MLEELIEDTLERAKDFFLGLTKRGKKLKRFAGQEGFRFFGKMKFDHLSAELEVFDVFESKSKKKITNILRKRFTKEAYSLEVFDFAYYKDYTKREMTMAIFKSPLVEMPEFQLRPKNVLHRVSELFISNEVDFSGYTEFDKRYKLMGKEDEKVNLLMLRSGLIDDLMDKHYWNIEAKGDYFVLYEYSKIVKVAEMNNFIHAATDKFKTYQKIILDDFDEEFGLKF